jgi:uncharacterized protein YjdB
MDQTFTATVTYADMRTADVTAMATWSSSAPSVFTINPNTGVAHAVSEGMATITASLPNGALPPMNITGTATATCTSGPLTRIDVTPPSANVNVLHSVQYTATGTFTGGSTRVLTSGVTWTSSAPSIATVSSTGLVTGVWIGSATIRATVGTVSGTASAVGVALAPRVVAITPPRATLATGATTALHAYVTYADASTSDDSLLCTWTSSDTSVATVDGTGLVTAVAPGTATITAGIGTLMDTATITVGP